MSNKWAMLNRETSEIVELSDYERSQAAKAEGYRKHLDGRKHDFTFTDMENITRVISAIDEKHCGYLLYLQCFISYEGVLTNNTHEKQAMTKADIQDAVGLKRTAFRDFFRSMTDKGIIIESDGVYYVNEAYHFKGTTENKSTIKSFTAKVRELYCARNAKKLGFIYKLLPYVHFETNSICTNPYEKDVKKINQLSKGEIAEITGLTEKTVYSYLRSMKLGEENVFAEISRSSYRFYRINPFIFYRKRGYPAASLREDFVGGFGKK